MCRSQSQRPSFMCMAITAVGRCFRWVGKRVKLSVAMASRLPTWTMIVATVGGAVTLTFGLWLFTAPAQFGWLPSVSDPADWPRAVWALLTILGVWSLALPWVASDRPRLVMAWWTMAGLWMARLSWQWVADQGKRSPVRPPQYCLSSGLRSCVSPCRRSFRLPGLDECLVG